MSIVFGLLFFVCIFALIVGLISPKAVIRWGVAEKKTRGKVLLYYGIGMIVLFIAIGVTSPKTGDDSKPVTAQQRNNDDQKPKDDAKAKADADAKAKADADAKAKADADAKAKADADAKAKAQAEAKAEAKNPKWNIKDVQVQTNGNFPLAVNLLKVMGDISQQGAEADAGDVFKTPWNYYGKPTKLSGTVAIVQDYPPGSDEVKAGYLSQIVFEAVDATPVIVLATVSSGNLKVGDDITMVGYPIGLESVENKLGGKTDELVLVTNKIQ